MRPLRHIAISTFFAGLAAAQPAVSNDLYSSYVEAIRVSNSQIVVSSDGKDYTKVRSGSAIKIEAHMDFSVITGRVKSWSIEPMMKRYHGLFNNPVLKFPNARVSESYSVGKRPQTVKVVREVTIPMGEVFTQALGQCRAMAEELRQQGKSNAEIFKKNRVIKVYVNAFGRSEVVGNIGVNFIDAGTAGKPVQIICAKHKAPPAATDTLAGGLSVVKATQKIASENTKGGHCAVKLVTAISTNKANALVKYRFIHSEGKKSKVFTAKTKGNKIAVVTHTWDIPNKPGTEVGWFMTKGVNVEFASNKSGYTMKCSDGVGGVAQVPGKPKVNSRIKPIGGLTN